MIHFDENAKIHLENYLKKVKGYLNCCKTVNTDEVIQNIIDHVEGELGHLSCVSTEQLNPVLKTLGSPERWIPQEELSLWKKIILRFRVGPEDWRLSYFSFILLVTSLITRRGFSP